ncbi:MAG: hypothetical protein U9R37_03235 [Campylobacterota bacterium]|nr:hypothetical protein [Campylobacterota bacterium]
MINKKVSDYETKFTEIEPDKIIKVLNIEQKSIDEAQKESPHTQATSLDVNEFNIQTYFKNKIKESNDFVIDKLAIFNNITARATTVINKVESIKHLHKKYENDMSHFMDQKKDEYINFKNELLDAKRDLERFKTKNDLDRDEISSKSPILNIAIILVVVLVESLLNAVFFATGSELGLLGGLGQALVVSLVNLILAYFTVIIWNKRLLVSLHLIVKGLLILLNISLLFLVFIFHLVVGHYRDALNINPEEAYVISIQNFINTPFLLSGFESWLLVFFGMLLFFILVIDIYKYKDPYPGFSVVTNRYKDIYEELESMRLEILEDMKIKEEEIESELKILIQEVIIVYDEVQAIPNFKTRLNSKYTEHISHLQSVYNLLIKRYRSINMSNRKTKYPEYFNNIESLKDYNVIDFKHYEDNINLKKLKTLLENISEIEADSFEKIRKITSSIKKSYGYLHG